MELLWLLGGAVLGAGGAFIAMRKPQQAPAAKRNITLTTGWRLSELGKPLVVADDVGDLDIPAGTRILAAGLVDPAVQGQAQVEAIPSVRAQFALDEDRRRALLFLGGVQRGTMAALTTDTDLVSRLDAEAKRMASRAETYVERRRIQELAGRHGVLVEVDGVAQDVLPYQEGFMIRLEDQGHIIGVLVQKDASELAGDRLRVLGRLEKDRSGYTVIQATDVRRIR
ncbi:MAG: hypothetical protein ACPHID_03635 [Thermoplasmatota archaeon]